MRRRRLVPALLVAVSVAVAVCARLAARRAEDLVAREIQRVGAPRGVSVRGVRLSWLGRLRLEGVAVQPSAARARLTIDRVDVHWRLLGGRDARAHVAALTLKGARLAEGPLAIEWPQAELRVVAWDRGAAVERVHLRQAAWGGEIEATWEAGGGGEAALSLSSFDLSGARAAWNGEAVLDPGRWSGRVTLAGNGQRLQSEGALSGQGVRVALPRGLGLGSGLYGAPTAVAVDWDLLREGGSIEVRRAAARLDGLELQGRGRLRGPAAASQVELVLSAHSELGAALGTMGVALPASLGAVPRERLGTATFDVTVRGPLADPSALRIVPRLRFESAPEAVEALQFLRRPFRYAPPGEAGRVIDVSEGAPGFVPLVQVPPLFVRTLLLSEDAGFFGHPGIDVAEMPQAWATNRERGTLARGASTITQQLAKNLFLSRDKSYGRKLTEAALALLLDAAVPKTRQLEIYLNVIEWGPGLYGLAPAARHYFGKSPAELTPKETVFLVCLIPNPVRYHQAHAQGHVGPGMDLLMENLLAKLGDAGLLGDAELAAAAEETLAFRPES